MNIEKERQRFIGWLDNNEDDISKEFENNQHERPDFTDYISFKAWQAAKQDGMTEEKARNILDPLPKSTLDGTIKFQKEDCYINADGNFQPVLSPGSGNDIDISLEKMKAIVWWMENKV